MEKRLDTNYVHTPEGIFLICHSDPIEIGKFFLYENYRGRSGFGICESVNNQVAIYECECGHCSLESRTIPLKYCVRIVKADPALN